MFYHIPSSGPAVGGVAVSKSDTTVLDPFRALWIGTSGDVVITTLNGTDITFKNAADGSVIPVGGTKVKAATTASDIVALY